MAMPGLADLEPMLAVPSALPAEPGRFAFEPKWDGMRALVRVQRGRMAIVSRNGIEQQERFPELAGIAAALRGREAILDGEVVAFDAKGRPDFGRLQGRFGLLDAGEIRRQAAAHPAHFLAFDLLWLDGKDLTSLPYRDRRRALEALRLAGDSWGTTPSVAGAGAEMLRMSRETGMEGVMAKRLDSPYRPGERSPAWLKVRNRGRQEFVVGGWTEGEGTRRGHFGSLLVGFHGKGGKPARARPGRLHFAGKVGSGYRTDDLESLQRALDRLATTRNPFAATPPDIGPVHFAQPRLVVEVEFNGVSRHGLLRQPSFKGLRTDKDPAQVVWEQAEVTPWHERSGAEPSVLAS
jgi:bifunctional non-homologous end joining protein LigD